MIDQIKKRLPSAVYLLCVFLAVILTGLMSTDSIGNGENVYLLIVTLEIVAFMLPSIIYCHLQGFEYAKGLELKIPELNKLPIIFSSLFAMISLNVLFSLFLAKIGSFPSQEMSGQGGFTGSGADVVGVIVALCVIPAICEEFVFRSVLMRDYNKYGARFSIIITSALFAMVHFDISRLVIYFASGILLALTVYITRSVLCSMIVHGLYNVYGMFFDGWFWSSISRNVNMTLIVFIFLAVLLVSFLVMFSEAQRLFVDYSIMGLKAPDGYEISKKRHTDEQSKIIAVPLIEVGICVLIFILNMIIKG